MLEEKIPSEVAKLEGLLDPKKKLKCDNEEDEDNTDYLPYLVNLHSKNEHESPYHWVVENGKDWRGNERFHRPNPIKFFFSIKHENSGKIESHLWFFKGFCGMTNPVYTQMVDAGTIPDKRSVSKICRY